MEIQLISNKDQNLIQQCINLAEQNYLNNLVLLGDLYPPCIKLTKIYGVFNNKYELISCFTNFEGFPSPSIVLPANLPNEIFTSVMNHLKETIPSSFSLVSFDLTEQKISNFFNIPKFTSEYCMYINNKTDLALFNSPHLKHVTEEDNDRINEFYRAINAYPWNPIQLESGFHYYIELENKIIACGGTHLETPRLAQLGNIYVLEEYRRQKFGKIITSNITHQILKKKEMAVLFVLEDNMPAISLYEKLGFKHYKPVKIFICENA